MVRTIDVTEKKKAEKQRKFQLKGLIRKIVGEDVIVREGEMSLSLSSRSGEDIMLIYFDMMHRGILRKPDFKDTMEEIGKGYEKIYGLDGKKEQFLIETDYS